MPKTTPHLAGWQAGRQAGAQCPAPRQALRLWTARRRDPEAYVNVVDAVEGSVVAALGVVARRRVVAMPNGLEVSLRCPVVVSCPTSGAFLNFMAP